MAEGHRYRADYIKFSSEINSGSASLIKSIKNKSNVAAQLLAKPFREVLMINKSLSSNRFRLQGDVQQLIITSRKGAIPVTTIADFVVS